MTYFSYGRFLAGLAVLSLLGCQGAAIEEAPSSQIPEAQCIALIEGVTEIPLKHGLEAKGNYYDLIAASDNIELAGCLVSQIINQTPVPDPRTNIPGPSPQLVIGDISIFMLTDMYGIPFTTFVQEDEWEARGIHAYYELTRQKETYGQIQEIILPHVESKFIDIGF